MKTAHLSADGQYRYYLSRRVGPGPTAIFIMLNPSTADAEVEDPTIRKCLGFCQRWGCGTLQVVNLFALRTPSPAALKEAEDPVGPENQQQFNQAMRKAHGLCAPQLSLGPLVCAWGAQGGYREQDLAVMGWLEQYPRLQPHCLGITKDGHPRHPLYVPYAAPLLPYIIRSSAF